MSPRLRLAVVVAVAMGCGGTAMPSEEHAATANRVAADGAAAPPAVLGMVSQGKVAAAAPASRAPAPPSSQAIAGDSVSRSMIIRTGHAQIEVDSIEPAIALVEALARRVGGYVAGSSIQAGEGQQRQATLQLRMPSARFLESIAGLNGIGELIASTTNAEDVGEEFVDVTARVANARRLEERLVTLLATRTGKLDDVLAVERELARVREEIERYTGRLRYLGTQVATSTLHVTLFEPAPVVGQPGSNVIVEALKQSWRNLVGVVAGGIALVGGLVPVLVLALIGFQIWKRWGRKQQVVANS